jgi:hypothetical protein
MAGKRDRLLAALLQDPSVYPVNLTLSFEAVFQGGKIALALNPDPPVWAVFRGHFFHNHSQPHNHKHIHNHSQPQPLTQNKQRCYIHYEFLPPQDTRKCPCDLVLHRSTVCSRVPVGP